MNQSDQANQWEKQVLEDGDSNAFERLLNHFHPRIRRLLQFRMNPRLQARVDPDDVIQETFLEAVRRIEDFRACDPPMSFFVWLRFLAVQKLNQLYRHHLGVQARDAKREIGLFQAPNATMTSEVLAAHLLGKMTSPSNAAIREENRIQLERGLSELDEMDREVLALRHFEQLSNSEVAGILQIAPAAASNRYFRAIRRLKTILTQACPGSTGIFQDR